ncbi:uncharacterized protein LOC130766113 [Actinidia eriantha]|uniref:uncharacterized protein LOC130766113 n=1 Tax=Actinidia eriantha TaxID=165200 RepID=UPI002587ACD1|nr:uncharacterized protein LOC130766113 [Actinidia eriantha]
MITCERNVFDEEVAAHPNHEQFLSKKIELYDEMALVVGKEMATRSFAKSFTDTDYERAAESNYNSIDFGANFEEASKGKQIGTSSEISSQARSHRKRTRDEDDSYDKLSEQIGEVATVIKKLSDD